MKCSRNRFRLLMQLLFSSLAVLLLTLLPVADSCGADGVPILLYHRFGATVADGMTVKTSVFEGQLQYLRDNGYRVIPLRQLVDWLRGVGPRPAAKSVVIVEDDAHKSVYTDMAPLVKKYRVPVTVFIYPSAISNATYAMTWGQLRELKKTGLFEFQSHSYWHPNFKKDRKKMSPAAFDKATAMQLTKSKERIERELQVKVDMLAWPFGICDDDLLRRARAAGYLATFSIERRHVVAGDTVMRLPRYLLINGDQGKSFQQVLEGRAPAHNVVY